MLSFKRKDAKPAAATQSFVAILLPYLTLIPTIFTVACITVIHLGGQTPASNSNYMTGQKKLFDNLFGGNQLALASWESSYTPGYNLNFTSDSRKVFLSRDCRSFECGKDDSTLECWPEASCSSILEGTGRIGQSWVIKPEWPYTFSNINLLPSYVLYMVIALPLAPLVFLPGIVHFRKGYTSKTARIVAIYFSGITLLIITAASILITIQASGLRNSIANTARSLSSNGGQNPSTTFDMKISDVSMGGLLMGLTWASVVAMILETSMWVWSWKTWVIASDN